MTTYAGYNNPPPQLYPRLPSAPPDERKVAPPRPSYPPSGPPRYPPPGMHRAGPVTGAVAVLPTNFNQNKIDGRPELPPKPRSPKQSGIVISKPKVIIVTQESKQTRKESSSESEPEVAEEPTKTGTTEATTSDPKVQKLRKRNYIFMALAGVSFLLCLNVICGAIALLFAILAEMDLGNGKVRSGSAKSVVSIILTIVGIFIAAILLTVFLVIHS